MIDPSYFAGGQPKSGRFHARDRALRKWAGGKKPFLAGVWDTQGEIGELDDTLAALNSAQRSVYFAEVLPRPSPNLAAHQTVLAELATARGIKTGGAGSEHSYFFANGYFEIARALRAQMRLDFLAALTPYLVALEEGPALYWNLFAASSGEGDALVSSYGLRDYAEKAGRPYTAAIGALLVPEALMAYHLTVRPRSRLSYHSPGQPDTGCLFDYNQQRSNIVESIRQLRIEPRCKRKIAPSVQVVADAWLRSLAEVKE